RVSLLVLAALLVSVAASRFTFPMSCRPSGARRAPPGRLVLVLACWVGRGCKAHRRPSWAWSTQARKAGEVAGVEVLFITCLPTETSALVSTCEDRLVPAGTGDFELDMDELRAVA